MRGVICHGLSIWFRSMIFRDAALCWQISVIFWTINTSGYKATPRSPFTVWVQDRSTNERVLFSITIERAGRIPFPFPNSQRALRNNVVR